MVSLLMFRLLTLAPAGMNRRGGMRSAPVEGFKTCKSPSLPTAKKAPGRPKPVASKLSLGGTACGERVMGGIGLKGRDPAGVAGTGTRRKPLAVPEAVLLPGMARAAVRPLEQEAVCF